MDANSLYTGKQQLQVGSGECLPIIHTGLVHLPILVSNKSLSLLNTLCVPRITKNLISVSKLVMDNPVFIEFTNKFFFVKDKETRLVLLYGVVKEGLYQLMVSNNLLVSLAMLILLKETPLLSVKSQVV